MSLSTRVFPSQSDRPGKFKKVKAIGWYVFVRVCERERESVCVCEREIYI